MSNDMNIVVLTGRLTKDAEVRFTTGGTPVANFALAVNEASKQQDGTWADSASFFDVQLWGKSAEKLQQYLTKGRQITVQGKLRQNTWQDQQTGQNRSRVVVNAFQVQLLSEPNQNGQYRQDSPSPPTQGPYSQSFAQQGGVPLQAQQRPAQQVPPQTAPARQPMMPGYNQAQPFAAPGRSADGFDPAPGQNGYPGPEQFNDDIPF